MQARKHSITKIAGRYYVVDENDQIVSDAFFDEDGAKRHAKSCDVSR